MQGSILTGAVLEPYAQALLSLGQERQLTDRFGEDVNLILETLQSSEELQSFLVHPFTQPDTKKAVLQQVFGQQVHPLMSNFLMLLVDRRRAVFLEGICQQYRVLLRKLNQTVLAEVTSTVELNDAQKQAVRDRVKAMTNAREVELQTSLDPDLIGGVIIQVGSQVIDASLRGQLRRISLRLAGAG